MGEGRKDRHFDCDFVDQDDILPFFNWKKRGRIRVIGWAIEFLGYSPEDALDSRISQRNEKVIKQEVRKAVDKLSKEERQFIEKFYFEFKSYQEIARILKKKIYKLERIHRRALDKLRILLADFAKDRFKLEVPQKTDCVICRSPFKAELDELIRSKKKEETYAQLIRTFKRRYGITITTPQVIIGHQRKHMV